ACVLPENPASYRVVRTKSYLFNKAIRVLQRYSLRMDGLYLYYPHRNVSPALRAVIDTLKI
ncbi:hypothetical protein POW31_24180, partial [Enterobacter roggenkampii]